MSDGAACRTIPKIPYSAFARRIGARVSTERTPLDGSLELTFRCNLRCAHCYVGEPGGDRRLAARELSTLEVRRITDEVVDRGCLWMLLTGGEPLLRRDLAEIYLHMKRRGLLVTLFTNGTNITPSFADLLAEWPPLVVEVSIYGSSPEVYERVTGVPGSFRRCIRGIELLLDRKVRMRVKTVPTVLNCADMDGMRALAAGY
jgi:MoaA/NifB/PqqE/SkfB family radical SAM enzyme